MNRHYSPNHPAVRHHRRNHPPTLAERTAAVRDRRGIPHRDPRTASRAVIAGSLWIMSVGLVETHTPLAAALIAGTVWAAFPWIAASIRRGR